MELNLIYRRLDNLKKKVKYPSHPHPRFFRDYGGKVFAAGFYQGLELRQHGLIHFFGYGVYVTGGFLGITADKLVVDDKTQGDHVGDAVRHFEDFGAVAA
jgi:hypothetical protein